MRQYVVDAFTDKVFGGNPAAEAKQKNTSDSQDGATTTGVDQ